MKKFRRSTPALNRLFVLFSILTLLPSVKAQFVELTTEAPVTFMLSTSTVTETTQTVTTRVKKVVSTAPQRDSKVVVSRIPQTQLLNQLLTAGIIPDGTISGWSFVARRELASQLRDVDGDFTLYLAKGTARVEIPEGQFFDFYRGGRTRSMVENHIGTFIVSSKGVVNNHLGGELYPDFTVGPDTFNVTDSQVDGIVTTNYLTKTKADGYNVFFYALSGTRGSVIGGFNGKKFPGNLTTTGLFTLTLTVGPAKLVPASIYTAE